MNTSDMIEKCIDAVLQPLSEKETTVRDHIVKEYFTPLKQKHWEGVELKDYWQELKRTVNPM